MALDFSGLRAAEEVIKKGKYSGACLELEKDFYGLWL